jgi:hypothetical protein
MGRDIRVLIADDQRLIRESIAAVLYLSEAPSRTTSPGSSPGWACATAPRRRSTPATTGSPDAGPGASFRANTMGRSVG